MPHEPIPLWPETLAFAAERHGSQRRKGSRVPYLTHLTAVAETLAYYYPEREPLILAGLLHDVVEDADVAVEELRTRFGPKVAELVHAVSKDDAAMEKDLGISLEGMTEGKSKEEAKVITWWERRKYMLRHLDQPGHDPDTHRDILRLKAADAHANLAAILRDLRNPKVGKEVWSRFKVGRADSLWFYEKIAEAVVDGLPGEQLAVDLSEVLIEVRLTQALR